MNYYHYYLDNNAAHCIYMHIPLNTENEVIVPGEYVKILDSDPSWLGRGIREAVHI